MKSVITLMLVLACLSTKAGVLPMEGRELNYRIIGFEMTDIPANADTRLEIAEGVFVEAAAFERHVTITKTFKGNRVIAEVPHWGTTYTWRMVTKGVPGPAHRAMFRFTTGACRYIDTNVARLRVVLHSAAFANSFVFADGFTALYNMGGRAVWYNPNLDKNGQVPALLRDYKVTPQHTITYLYKNTPTEINWAGKVLWNAPDNGEVSGDSTEGYHHEFVRLRNGHYMVMGNEKRKGPDGSPTEEYTTVIEYDSAKRVVWHWKSGNALYATHYDYGRKAADAYDVHGNAFFFDEDKKILYVGFKNTSQILKVSYPEGRVMGTMGRNYTKPGTSPFYQQHAIGINTAGDLYVFDNHNADGTLQGFRPRVLVGREVNGHFKTNWMYEYTSPFKMKDLPPLITTFGGNVVPLKGNSYFVSMCSPYADFFIVNQQKKLLWAAIPETADPATGKWIRSAQYRGSIIASEVIVEQLIWNN